MKKILTIMLAIGLIATFTACNNKEKQSGDKLKQTKVVNQTNQKVQF